jgi:hypothetical protein
MERLPASAILDRTQRLSRYWRRDPEAGNRTDWHFRQTEVIMLVTLVAILCNGQLCLEKVVTSSEQSGITMAACQTGAQAGIADWLANGPYRTWKLEGYRCVAGTYVPKHDI